MCVCVCVCARARASVCMCTCVGACVGGGGRGVEAERLFACKNRLRKPYVQNKHFLRLGKVPITLVDLLVTAAC